MNQPVPSDANEKNQRRARLRRGVAVVELAVCLPILVLVTFATIEACTMIYLQQSLEIAAYEGARVALVPGSDENNVIGAAQQVLADRTVQNPTITVTPAAVESVPFGQFITVSVTAPCSDNSMMANWFFGSRTITAEVQMMKET